MMLSLSQTRLRWLQSLRPRQLMLKAFVCLPFLEKPESPVEGEGTEVKADRPANLGGGQTAE